MNKKEKCYENYPAGIVFLSNLAQILIYLAGAIIIYQLGIIYFVLYIIFILILEFRLMRNHCVDCYYYGKYCAFGRGKISSLFFQKGNSKNFCKIKLTWKDLFVDFLVSLIPIVVGIILIIIDFSWIILLLIIILIILSSLGNAFIRGNLACKYCRQREIGCPAQKLFEKKK